MLMLIDYASASIAMFDREMRCLAVSQRWRDDYGLGRREILGQSHYELFPEIRGARKAAQLRGLAGETITADWKRRCGRVFLHEAYRRAKYLPALPLQPGYKSESSRPHLGHANLGRGELRPMDGRCCRLICIASARRHETWQKPTS